MGISGITNSSVYNPIQTVTRARKNDNAEGIEKSSSFPQISAEKPKTCPYDYLSKDGLIEYNGVSFVCDYKTNSICLGDMSNEKEVLNISLPSGGNLKVNVNNFGDLAKAAGMFSPADLNAIMRAISQYNHCTSKLNELEEEETKTTENAAEHGAEQVDEPIEEPTEDEDIYSGVENFTLTKYQEIQLTESTTIGTSSVNGATECASYETGGNGKVWTITCIGKDGISSKKCRDGMEFDSWEIKFTNPDEAKRVEDFIAGFKKDANLKFAGVQAFWSLFLTGSISKDNLVELNDTWTWE